MRDGASQTDECDHLCRVLTWKVEGVCGLDLAIGGRGSPRTYLLPSFPRSLFPRSLFLSLLLQYREYRRSRLAPFSSEVYREGASTSKTFGLPFSICRPSLAGVSPRWSVWGKRRGGEDEDEARFGPDGGTNGIIISKAIPKNVNLELHFMTRRRDRASESEREERLEGADLRGRDAMERFHGQSHE